MRSWLASILLLMVSATLLAQTAAKPKTSTTTTTTTTTTTAKPKAKKPAATAKKPMAVNEIKALRDAVSAQQQQIQMLRDELARRDAAVQQVQQQVNSLQSATQRAQSAAQAAEACCKTNEDALAALKTNIASVQTTATATANSLQATEKKITALESPATIKYKGITLTPGGFISANVNWRQHNQNGDNFASYGAIPFSGSSNGNMAEFRETARYSRISLLAQGKTKSFDAQAYFEADFEGAAQTANENQTNSWQPRLREAWVNIDAPKGVSFAGGQTWGLFTPNRTGVGVRGLMLPAHIDATLVLGFQYTRQNGFRVTKRWDLAGKKKVYLAFAAEEAQTTSTGTAPSAATFTIFGLQGATAVSLGGGTNPTATTPGSTFAAGISVNPGPDLVAKVAIEPGWGHFELGALGRFFRDRIDPTTATGVPNPGSNHTTPGGGVTFNGVMPVAPSKVDIVFASTAGRGTGRYLGVPDVTFRPDGRLEPLLNYSAYLGIETHPRPNLDFLVYAGDVYTKRTTYITGGTALLPTGTGYGLISSDLRGCNMELPTAVACGAFNKNNYEITPGFWYRFYKGPAGTIQFGAFYEYIHRTTWAGRQDATGALPKPLQASQNVIYTSFRWYFP